MTTLAAWYFYFFALNIFNPGAAPLSAQLGPFATLEQCERATASLHTGLSKLAGSGWQLWTIECWPGSEAPPTARRHP